jgi:hypothetical protein
VIVRRLSHRRETWQPIQAVETMGLVYPNDSKEHLDELEEDIEDVREGGRHAASLMISRARKVRRFPGRELC